MLPILSPTTTSYKDDHVVKILVLLTWRRVEELGHRAKIEILFKQIEFLLNDRLKVFCIEL